MPVPDAARGMSRRDLLSAALVVANGALIAPLRLGDPEVTIATFSDAGERTGTARVPKMVLTDAEWMKRLPSRLAFEVTRHGDTEIAFTGAYWNLHEAGLFRCVCCDTALFSSTHKFDSGTGWPSFTEPADRANVELLDDFSYGMHRIEVNCAACGGHLGHVFPDGPGVTGERYCINSCSLELDER